MTFLTGLAAKVIEWGLAKLAAAAMAGLASLWASIKLWNAMKKRRKKTDELVEKKKEAKTDDEFDKAAEEAIRNI